MKKRERAKPSIQAARELFEVGTTLGNTAPTEWSSTNPSVIMVSGLAENVRERTTIQATITRPAASSTSFQTHYTIFNTSHTRLYNSF